MLPFKLMPNDCPLRVNSTEYMTAFDFECEDLPKAKEKH